MLAERVREGARYGAAEARWFARPEVRSEHLSLRPRLSYLRPRASLLRAATVLSRECATLNHTLPSTAWHDGHGVTAPWSAPRNSREIRDGRRARALEETDSRLVGRSTGSG